MNVRQKRERPAATERGFRTNFDYSTKPNTTKLPRNWRERLPDPSDYYRARIDGLSTQNAAGFASAKCRFHVDDEPSLSVKLSGRGPWRCHATGCGLHGDMIDFHQRVTGLQFADAVRDLLRGGR